MLLYILGAIFLIGFLIVLVKGSFQEGTGISQDKVVITVTEMQRYAAEVERGVGYILRDYSETDIRFAHPNASAGYGLITDTPGRQVFSTGGGVDYKDPPAGVNDGTKWAFAGTTHLKNMGTNSPAANTKPELLMVLPNVKQEICARVNMVNGQNIDLTVVSDPGICIAPNASDYFVGTFLSGAAANTVDDTKFTKFPAYEACVKCASGSFNYYHVLLAR